MTSLAALLAEVRALAERITPEERGPGGSFETAWSVQGPVGAEHGPQWEVSTRDGHGVWVARTPSALIADLIALLPRLLAIAEGQPGTDADLIESAWGIIANAGGGAWTRETPDWQESAARWRTKYHAMLDRKPPTPPPTEQDHAPCVVAIDPQRVTHRPFGHPTEQDRARARDIFNEWWSNSPTQSWDELINAIAAALAQARGQSDGQLAVTESVRATAARWEQAYREEFALRVAAQSRDDIANGLALLKMKYGITDDDEVYQALAQARGEWKGPIADTCAGCDAHFPISVAHGVPLHHTREGSFRGVCRVLRYRETLTSAQARGAGER